MSLNAFNNSFRPSAVPFVMAALTCAPNLAAQSITANTISTPALSVVLADSATLGVTVGSNQVQNLPEGTYYCEASLPLFTVTGANGASLRLYNDTGGAYLPVSGGTLGGANSAASQVLATGQFDIGALSSVSLRLICPRTALIRNGDQDMTDATANADQRTTLKLWKLA